MPESLVLRGPLSAQDQYVTGVPIGGGIDNPGGATAPAAEDGDRNAYAGHARLHGHCTVPGAHRCALSDPVRQRAVTLCRSGEPQRGHQRQHRRFDQQSRAAGARRRSPDDLQLMMTGPATVLPGTPVTYTLTVTNNGSYPIGAADAPLVTDACRRRSPGPPGPARPRQGQPARVPGPAISALQG